MNRVNEYLIKIYMKGEDDPIDESTIDDDHATIGVCGKQKKRNQSK